MRASKIVAFVLVLTILCFSFVITPAAETRTIKIGYYNVESGKMEIGTAKLKSHTPEGYSEIMYDVIDEATYRNNGEVVTPDIKAKLIAIATCTDKVFDGGVNFSGTKIDYKRFGRVDSNAWHYSLTIAPLVVPMLDKDYGIEPDSITWFCLGDKKGKSIRVYMEIAESPVTEVVLHQDSAYIFGKDDYHMAPEEPTERQEACAMLYRLLLQNNATGSFVPGKTTADYWSKNAMDYMQHIGMYNSLPNVYENITRGETFKLFCLSLGFTDKKDESVDFYADILQQKGYVIGDENHMLNLSSKITRAEFCKIYNMITGKDKMLLVDTDGNDVTPEYYGFKDLDENEWYCDVMLKATSSYSDKKVDINKRATRNELDNY